MGQATRSPQEMRITLSQVIPHFTRNHDKVLEWLGRLRERKATVNHHYNITVTKAPDGKARAPGSAMRRMIRTIPEWAIILNSAVGAESNLNNLLMLKREKHLDSLKMTHPLGDAHWPNNRPHTTRYSMITSTKIGRFQTPTTEFRIMSCAPATRSGALRTRFILTGD